MKPKTKAEFIEPMLLLRTNTLPEGANWLYEIKLDGYRALAIKTKGKVQLRSRNDHDFTRRYRAIVKALGKLPDETVIDGEVVALDEAGRPSFNILQNYGSSAATVLYYVFDVPVLGGRNLTGEPLERRRELLRERILPTLSEPIRHSPELKASLADLIESVRAQGLEGLVAKRRDSRYEKRLPKRLRLLKLIGFANCSTVMGRAVPLVLLQGTSKTLVLSRLPYWQNDKMCSRQILASKPPARRFARIGSTSSSRCLQVMILVASICTELAHGALISAVRG